MTTRTDGREYRVIVEYSTPGRRHTVDRPENPFEDVEEARKFAARFTPPKFNDAWVETRTVGVWRRLP